MRRFVAALLLIGTIPALLACGGGDGAAAAPTQPPPADQPAGGGAPAASDEPIEVTAEVLWGDFNGDLFAAQAKYKGKPVLVTGIKRKGLVPGELSRQPIASLMFDIGNPGFGIECAMAEEDRPDFEPLAQWTIVKVSGTVAGRGIKFINVVDCELVEVLGIFEPPVSLQEEGTAGG